jgi:hypothetical protein
MTERISEEPERDLTARKCAGRRAASYPSVPPNTSTEPGLTRAVKEVNE